jgi:hypothetical protein
MLGYSVIILLLFEIDGLEIFKAGVNSAWNKPQKLSYGDFGEEGREDEIDSSTSGCMLDLAVAYDGLESDIVADVSQKVAPK